MENQKLWLLQRIHDNDVPPIVIKEGLYKVGRNPDASILCRSEWVSRYHCYFMVRDGLVYIRDLGSLNGTFIEDTEILKERDIQLKHGDVISLGKPFSGGNPETGHYVYRLVACSEPQEPKIRKRKASDISPVEEKNISSPKRRRTLSAEKVSSSDKVLQCIDLTNDEVPDSQHEREHEHPAEMSKPLTCGTVSKAGSASPDSSVVKCLIPVDLNISSTTPTTEKIVQAVMKILQNRDSKNVLKTIELISEEMSSKGEKTFEAQKSADSLCTSENNSSVRIHQELVNGVVLNSDMITSSNVPVSSTEESTSYQIIQKVNNSAKQISQDNDGLNNGFKLHKGFCGDIASITEGYVRLSSSTTELGKNKNSFSNKPNLMQPPSNQIDISGNGSSNSHEDVEYVDSSKLVSPNIVTEKLQKGESLIKEPKEQDDKPQLKKVHSGYLKSELKNIDNVLNDSNAKENNSLLILNKYELCDSRVVENSTKNLGNQCEVVSLNEIEKRNSENTYTIHKSADSTSEISQNNSCKLPHQVEETTNITVENMKQEIISKDVGEEMVFSQDDDGVVVIDLSEDELEYSQLFMEQDEVEKEKEIENMDTIVKDEIFYDAEDNEEIELFQSHFSQCSQEQEMIREAETPKRKIKSRSLFSDVEFLSKEQLTAVKSINSEGAEQLKIQDVRIKLNRVNVEPYCHSNVPEHVEKMVEEHLVTDENLSEPSKPIGLKVKPFESDRHKSNKSTNSKQMNHAKVIDLDKLEIIKFDKSTISRKKSLNILKKDEINKVSVDNDSLRSLNSSLTKTFDSDQTEMIETNKESIPIERIKPVVESVKLNDKELAVSNKLSDEKSTLNKKYPDIDRTTIVKPQKEESVAFSKSKRHESNYIEQVDSLKISVNSNIESMSNENREVESKKDFLKSYNFQGFEAVDNKSVSIPVKIPPPESISGAQLVKSTLLSRPPIPKRKPGRPKKNETSVTKESLKKKKQKEIVEDRKAKLKSLALKEKSKTKDSEKNQVKQKEVASKIIANKDVTKTALKQDEKKLFDKNEQSRVIESLKDNFTNKPESSNIKNEVNLSRAARVAKVTERNRSSILLEGFLEAPDSRRSRTRRKAKNDSNISAQADSTKLAREPAACSDRSKEFSEARRDAPKPISDSGKLKSCLKIVGVPSSNKTVTFNLDLNVRTFECEGILKSVNAMISKDKAAPSSRISQSLRELSVPIMNTLDETFFDVVHWNASWVNEVKVVPGEPPVYEEKYNAKDSYVSYKDYRRWLYPLMMYELWGNMCKTMIDEDTNKTGRVFDGIVLECLHYGVHHATNGKNLLMLKVFFPLYGKQVQTFVDPMDILLIKAQSTCKGQRICFVLFGLVYTSIKISSYRETSDPIARHYLSTLNKQPDICAYFDIIIYKSQKKQVCTGFQLRIRPVYNMMTELRQFEGLLKLCSSPLAHIIIDPIKNNSVYLHKDLNNKIVSQYPLNAEQQNAVLCTAQCVFASKPSISLIHGPPGTGKTQVIVAIIEQLLYRYKLKNNCKRKKILICSQSNAAIDEICLRLLDVRKQLPREKRFKLTRFGRKEKIHPRVLEIQTATLARKEIEKRNLNDDFTLELSLQRATERMVATALEKSNSPNIENYKKKYEKVQKIIAGLEAIVNNTSSNEARSKEIEKLIFDEEMKVIYHSDIIATTLGSCSQRKMMKAFNELSRSDERREIGVCIVDEATQATEADLLMPLVYDVKNFILVGDPQQLSPYVYSQTAKKHGLGQSLFSRLYKAWSGVPSSPVYKLSAQHRMHPEIAHFPSKTFYNSLLATPDFLAIKRPFKPYAVITHQSTQDAGNGETNLQEACMIVKIAETLLSEPDMKGLSIGLIVPYQRQRSLILELFHDKKLLKQLSVNTIDSYQGQEKDVILLSCVRTSGVGFLNDSQRINVALTRAKKALYIIANFSSLQATNIWKELLADARERNLHFTLGQSGKVEEIFDFLFERNKKKSRTSSS